MKKNIFILIYSVLLIFIFSSCEKDNIGPTYSSNTDEPAGLSLLWSTGNLVYKPNSEEASIPIIRHNSSGTLTVPVIVTYDQSAFTIPTSVTFEDGQGQALLKFSLANAVLSKTYSISLNLDVDSSLLITYGTFNTGSTPATKPMSYGIKKASISLLKDYDWVNLGEGILNSAWFVEDGIGVQIQKADGYDVYRAINIYSNGYNMAIEVNGTTATVPRQLIQVSSNYPIYVEGSGTFVDRTFTLTLDFWMYTPTGSLYYSELGDTEVIILPEP